jgi:hypothetical protein
MSEKLQHEVALNKEATQAGDRVPFGQKIAYSMGVVSDHYANICLSTFLTAFFVDFLKLGAAMVGYRTFLSGYLDGPGRMDPDRHSGVSFRCVVDLLYVLFGFLCSL